MVTNSRMQALRELVLGNDRHLAGEIDEITDFAAHSADAEFFAAQTKDEAQVISDDIRRLAQ